MPHTISPIKRFVDAAYLGDVKAASKELGIGERFLRDAFYVSSLSHKAAKVKTRLYSVILASEAFKSLSKKNQIKIREELENVLEQKRRLKKKQEKVLSYLMDKIGIMNYEFCERVGLSTGTVNKAKRLDLVETLSVESRDRIYSYFYDYYCLQSDAEGWKAYLTHDNALGNLNCDELYKIDEQDLIDLKNYLFPRKEQ